VAAAHEERFSRKKHDASFPLHAARYVLEEAGVDVPELTAIAFYDKPFLKFERLLETYDAFAPRGLRSFLSAIPVWIKEKLFMKRMLREEIERVAGAPLQSPPPLLFPEHHLSHAASAFYPSPYEEAAILTVDGVGEWATATVGRGRGREIEILRELDFPHSVGLLYSAFTYYCGFKVNRGEYKLMGLAPYGRGSSERVRRWEEVIRQRLVDLREDGSFLLNMDHFDFATGLRMCHDDSWEELFGLPRRKPESELTQPYMDMALAIQRVTEDIVFRLARTAVELAETRKLVMAGGVALNCVGNGKLRRVDWLDDLWVQPAAGDAGGALGAAYAAHHIWAGNGRRVPTTCRDDMAGAYLGPRYARHEIRRVERRYRAPCVEYDDFDELCGHVADALARGEIVGWFQGRMEWGPRALGNRSILGDPRSPDTQKTLNMKIKFREGFRPFAPSVLAEDCSEYFDLAVPSPYMLLVAPVVEGRREALPDDYEELGMYERLYHRRSDIPAVTHVDYSARVQTVHRDTNARYWRLLRAFKERTGYGLLVNTSFNVRGEPIACTPDDAYRCFMRTEMDWLVMENLLFDKREQADLEEEGDWRDRFELD